MLNTQEIVNAMLLQEELDFPENQIKALSYLIDENHDIDDFIDLQGFGTEDFNDNRQAIIDALETFKTGGDDFYLKFDGNEYRIITYHTIWDTYVEEIKNIVTDCYDLKLDSIPDFIALEIDWDKTANNAYADGYGHTFSSYDGSEIETGDYWIFRVN